MKGNLDFDYINKNWFVKWLNISQMYPSIAVGGSIKLHPEDVEVIEVYQMYLGQDKTLIDKEVDYIELDGFAKLIEPGTDYELSLYSKIETAIISWSNDGTKTAGTLTREIIKLIEENNSK